MVECYPLRVDHPGAIAGLVAVTIALSKVIEGLIAKISPAKRPDNKLAALLEQTHDVCVKTWDILERHDADGVPLTYVPRSWAALLNTMLAAQRELAETQRRTVEMLERMERNTRDG